MSELSQTLQPIRECDQQPIHQLGAIQGHGALLAFSADDLRVVYASQSTVQFLNVPMNEILHSKIMQLCESGLANEIARCLHDYPWPGSPSRHLKYKSSTPEPAFDALLYRSGNYFVLEFEHLAPSASDVPGETLIKDFMLQAQPIHSAELLGRLVCHQVREILGMDRVMLYKFLPPAMHGEVIAEDKVVGAHSYLGHRFPSADIPLPARMLYLRNQVRAIPDVQAAISTIEAKESAPLDLTDSRLRAVAPVHLEYLVNMGVRSSFSVALTVRGELWGLIACHSAQPTYVRHAVRTLCEIIAQTFSIHVERLEALEQSGRRLKFDEGLRELIDSLHGHCDVQDALLRQHRQIANVFNVTGTALVSEGRADFAGVTPPKADLHGLFAQLNERWQRENFRFLSFQDLNGFGPQWAQLTEWVCGLLVVPIEGPRPGFLLFFRPEFLRTVTWGGDPRKQLERRDFQGTLNPRESFETWNELIRGQSQPWIDFEINGALFLRNYLFHSTSH